MTPTSPHTRALADLEDSLDSIPADAVAAILGDLERIKARLWMRMNESTKAPPREAKKPDRLLDVNAVAELLGVKPRWVLEHADEIGRKARLPGKQVRFSERKLRQWMDQRTT